MTESKPQPTLSLSDLLEAEYKRANRAELRVRELERRVIELELKLKGPLPAYASLEAL